MAINESKKDWWDKSKIIGSILTPVVVLLLGILFNNTFKEQELKAAYVRVAIETLSNADTSEVAYDLKKWALTILDESSPSPIPPKLRASVLSIEMQEPNYLTGGGFGSGSGFGFVTLNTVPEENLYVLIDGDPIARTPSTINFRTGHREVSWQNEKGEEICFTSILLSSESIKELSCDSSTRKVQNSKDD